MTKKIKIPASVELASDRLVTLEGLATATGWERAAIVYAFTYDAKRGGGANRNAQNGALTVAAFAALKIKGLMGRNTVDSYREAWKHAIEQGAATAIVPGDTVVLPDLDWPVGRTGTDGYDSTAGAKKTIEKIIAKHGTEILDDAIDQVAEEAPEVIAAQVAKPRVADATISNPKARSSMSKQGEKSRQQSAAQSSMPKPKGTPTAKDDKADDMTDLDRTIAITDLMITFTDAKIAADKATEILEKAARFLTDEQRTDLEAGADSVIAAWSWVKSLTVGVTDDDLHEFIADATGTEG